MSSTSPPSTNDLALPVAAIVCISVVCYTLLIIGILVLRYYIRRHQLCQSCECRCCGEEKPLECSCCEHISCNCNPSLNQCLNKICPNRKDVAAFWRKWNLSCVDILMCQCFAGPNNCCTNTQDQNFMTCCVCPFNREYKHFTCCCFDIGLRTATSISNHELGMPASARSHHRSPRRPQQGSTIVESIHI